jgi:2-oxoglutarate dehydrogenase E1 component
MQSKPFDFGVNAGFVEELYAQYQENPEKVDASWRSFFEAQRGLAAPAPTYPKNGAARTIPPARGSDPERKTPVTASTQELTTKVITRARVVQLVNAYRVRGHLFAHVDPLGVAPSAPPELDLANFELHESDLDKQFPTVDLAGTPPTLSLREIIGRLEETYCRSIGVEFTHVEEPAQRNWLRERMESTRNHLELDHARQLRILTKLSDAEIFEQFIHRSYAAGTKRFSLEGGEALIPLLDEIIERSAAEGVEEIVLGMAHRGRLNVLANILGKSPREIFAHFEDADPGRYLGGGDVKYHLGYSSDRVTDSGQKVHLTLTFNPSHLEFVNPVVEGRVRAKQDRLASSNAERAVMPLLIHGDAAFIGQGVVPETLNMCALEGYRTGGTIHIIVNNQVGFTTNPNESRSTRYSSDITRMLKVPVFHVNGEDPEAVAQVAQLASEWRQKFAMDVVIDMYCYRRYGHNEGDEPRYTQPRMYAIIDKKPTVRQMYVKRLVEMGQVTAAHADEILTRRREVLEKAHEEVKQKGYAPVTYTMGGVWSCYRGGRDADTAEVQTGVAREKLVELSAKLLEMPEKFKVHPKVLPILKARHDRLVNGEPFDWGTGEMLAYATLLSEKVPVRISGQDVRRGTFSHRHAVVFDTESGAPFAPLSNVLQPPARIDVFNSPLSEAGVLGFEFGYALDYPDALVIWEAQFGDFLNGAQVIVDQFITSSEDKWHRLSGLVLFLPHGYEGQGPEHSSARIERFLQNSAEDNIQVCNLTTPAQLFHCLRRQIHRPWRKPLVIATPKSLLRVATTSTGPRPVSTIDDLVNGRFQRVIGDNTVDPSKVKKILFCSGKVYYDLAVAREQRGIDDVAIVRLEQLFPYNHELDDALASFAEGTKLVWVQEEPINYGSWYYINSTLPQSVTTRFPLSVVARGASASPATGSKASHTFEQKKLIDEAFA